jgi:hypothetical protein
MPDAVNFWLGEAAAVTSCRCGDCRDGEGAGGAEEGKISREVEGWASDFFWDSGSQTPQRVSLDS